MLSITEPRKKYPQGIVIYDGPSKIDGKRIIVVATGFNGSDNPKTGNMVQLWILPWKENPIVAYAKGNDTSVCGDCKHRSPKSGGWGTCYVSIHQAPYQVWNAFKRGRYEPVNNMNMHAFEGKHVRLGSYGDPAAVPFEVWEKVCSIAKGYTGYTHLWNRSFCDKRLKQYCMASVDSMKELKRAQKKGWRTFRIRFDNSICENEIVCPASKEAGEKTNCQSCGFCNGADKNKTVTIKVHGRSWKIKRFAKIMKLRRQKKAYRHLIKR